MTSKKMCLTIVSLNTSIFYRHLTRSPNVTTIYKRHYSFQLDKLDIQLIWMITFFDIEQFYPFHSFLFLRPHFHFATKTLIFLSLYTNMLRLSGGSSKHGLRLRVHGMKIQNTAVFRCPNSKMKLF